MTPDQLDATLIARRDALRLAQQAQAAELRARQKAGDQRVGPWAPVTKLGRPKRQKRTAVVTEIRRRA